MHRRTAEETVLEFQELMHRWEAECALRDASSEGGDDLEAAETIAMAEYSRIFEGYCSSRATPRSFCYSEPPEYEIGAKIMDSVEGEQRCKLTVECLSFPDQRHEYSLLRERGEWLILQRNIVTDRGTRISADL